jgi:hypothetical protein
MLDAYNPDRQILFDWYMRKPNRADLRHPDLYRRVRALLACEDATETEHTALAAELLDVLDPPTAEVAPKGGWSKPLGVAQWAKVFNVGRVTMRKVLKGQRVRNRCLGRQSYVIAIDDIPAEHRGRFRQGG